MIDFYALTSPNVQKIFVMLEECGLPYNIKPVDVWAGEQFTPEFARINPLLKVPAIVDSDGPSGKPYTVIESGAILIYLAEKTGKFIPHEPVARYDTLQWVILQVANVGPMAGQHVHFSKFAGPGNDYSACSTSSTSTSNGYRHALTSLAVNTPSLISRHGHGCAISNCWPSTLPNIQKSSPGRTRSHRATRSSGRSHRSAP
jgi:glutathione S-transferase